MMKSAILSALLWLGTPVHAAPDGGAAPAAPTAVTLRGQVVCSLCWDEADRTKVRYGTKEDFACARACAKKNVPAALAVAEKGSFELYVLEDGTFPRKGTGWLDYLAKTVEVTGPVTRTEKLARLKVDALRVVSEPVR